MSVEKEIGNPQLQRVLDRIAVETVRHQRAYRRARILDMAGSYSTRRITTLSRFGIVSDDPVKIVRQLKLLLRTDAALRRNEPAYARIPLHRWNLLAAWIGERRLAKRFAYRSAAE